MWIAIILALVLCAGAGLFLGAMQAAQDPRFYVAIVKMVIDVVLPEILKRMPAEEEAEWRQAVREGRGADYIRKRQKG